MVCILFGEISIFHSRVMGLYSSNCRRFFVCRTVNWEPLRQFTSNFAQLLELIVLRSVYFLVKFRFFIQELWERKSLQILYECWRRAYHALLAQLFIDIFIPRGNADMHATISPVVFLYFFLYFNHDVLFYYAYVFHTYQDMCAYPYISLFSSPYT